jgi:hypothetical protein
MISNTTTLSKATINSKTTIPTNRERNIIWFPPIFLLNITNDKLSSLQPSFNPNFVRKPSAKRAATPITKPKIVSILNLK